MSDEVIPLIIALEKAAFAGKIVPEGVRTLHNTVAHTAQVINNEIIFDVDGERLNVDETVEKLIRDNKIFAPIAPKVEPKTIELDAIKERALAGNLTAHGQLVRKMGLDAYRAWQSGVKTDDVTKIKQKNDNPNPWSAEAWNVTEQGRITRALGIDKARAFAKSAGSEFGATKPPEKKSA